MKLPNRENAFVPTQKLKDYLLSETHPVGKAKAKFFRSFGYNEANVELLERGLLTIALNQEVNETVSSPLGMKYIVDGALHTPVGRKINLKTVWIIDKGQDRPRFVTAVPI